MKLLIVEDEPIQRNYLKELLIGAGHTVLEADDGESAIEILSRHSIDVIITDYKLKKMNGMLLIQYVKKNAIPSDIIMLTAFSNTQDAIFAMKIGAYDYLTKPLNFDELELLLLRIQQKKELESQVEGFETAQSTDKKMIYVSNTMRDVIDNAKKAAEADVTILISGESGTGKELLADFIHRESTRRNQPFVKVFCAALPENLIESELFGYKKGAFTGADKDYKGKFEAAHRGSILLDEVTEISLATQVKLLRVVQEKEISRLGEVLSRPIDVRIIAATNRQIIQEVGNGKFREDLYYRLNVYPIHIPPLRDRKQDIQPLIDHFLHIMNKKYNKNVVLSSIENDLLINYDWPGNIRELENIITNIVISGSIQILTSLKNHSAMNMVLEKQEKKAIEETLLLTNGNQTKTAQILGIHRNTLLRKIKAYNIKT